MLLPDNPVVPPDWQAVLHDIITRDIRRVVVLGPVDAGKSTFCRWLFQEGRNAERHPVLIDADPGQKMLGPPATLTRSRADDLHQLEALVFTGTTSAGHMLASVRRGLPLLAGEASGDLLIVNTSGLTGGVGHALKSAKLAIIQPDLVIVLGDDPNLQALLHKQVLSLVCALTVPDEVRRKSRAERRAARQHAFQTWFQSAKERTLLRARLFVAGNAELYARQLVGVADGRGHDLGLALVDQCCPRSLTLLMPGDIRRPRLLRPGRLWLDADFKEMNEAIR